ncbi:MAG: hypothetical protein ACPF8W_08390 [Luminiphilus sp.]
MTDQHPLTDDIIRYDKKLGCHDLGTWIYTENDLRAAADWQQYLEEPGTYTQAIRRFDQKLKAMRPTTTTTTTQENN